MDGNVGVKAGEGSKLATCSADEILYVFMMTLQLILLKVTKLLIFFNLDCFCAHFATQRLQNNFFLKYGPNFQSTNRRGQPQFLWGYLHLTTPLATPLW